MKDLYNNIELARAISPAAAVTDNTALVSQILDRANAESSIFIGLAGSLADTDATFTVLVEDGDDAALADNAAVADAYLHGVEAGLLTKDNDNDVFKIGYHGPKRYVRVTITPADNTGNVFLAGAWLKSGLRKLPKSTQVVAG